MKPPSRDLQVALLKRKNDIFLTKYDLEVLRVYDERFQAREERVVLEEAKRSMKCRTYPSRKKKKKKKDRRISVSYTVKQQKAMDKAIALSEDQKSHPTPCEVILFKALRKRRIKFEYQKPLVFGNVSFCSLDFYFPHKKLAVELDGYHHSTDKGKKKDTNRTKRLMKYHGVSVIRFWNEAVKEDVDGVINQIIDTKQRLLPII